MGSVHNVLRSAAEQAGVINRGQDLSRIRTGLHDELFHGGTPCHGDVFHIIRQCEGLANTLPRVAEGVTSRRKKLEAQFGRAG
jgi:hypothetical protein